MCKKTNIEAIKLHLATLPPEQIHKICTYENNDTLRDAIEYIAENHFDDSIDDFKKYAKMVLEKSNK